MRTVWLCLAGLVLLAACGGGAPDLNLSAEGAAGREITLEHGCAACHGEYGEGAVGPSWEGLFGTVVELEGGATAVVDEAFLRRAIVEPDAEILLDAQVVMPFSTLTDEETEAVITYIMELQ